MTFGDWLSLIGTVLGCCAALGALIEWRLRQFTDKFESLDKTKDAALAEHKDFEKRLTSLEERIDDLGKDMEGIHDLLNGKLQRVHMRIDKVVENLERMEREQSTISRDVAVVKTLLEERKGR